MNRSRPKVRLSRAIGMPLTPKCVAPFERRPYPPGVHGRRRSNPTDYKLRLLEKQRLRLQYNLREKQLRRTFDEARRLPGKSGENLVTLLERRLDATVFRAGFARTIYQARQFVVHQHITVNGVRVDRPSYRTRPGDVIEVAPRSRSKHPFQVAAAGGYVADGPPAPYLAANHPELRVVIDRIPVRREVPVLCDEALVVEFYSR